MNPLAMKNYLIAAVGLSLVAVAAGAWGADQLTGTLKKVKDDGFI